VILCTAAFLPDDALAFLGVSAKATKVIIGFSSSLILFLSIANLCVDWGSLSGRYGEAADRLAKAKGRFREVLNKEAPIAPEEAAKLSAEYNQALDGLPRIPDRQFAKLKAYHHRKVRLSQMIEKFVGCPVWVLRWRLLREGLRGEQDKAKGSDS